MELPAHPTTTSTRPDGRGSTGAHVNGRRDDLDEGEASPDPRAAAGSGVDGGVRDGPGSGARPEPGRASGPLVNRVQVEFELTRTGTQGSSTPGPLVHGRRRYLSGS